MRHQGKSQGAFKSFPVESDEYLYSACRYVERNPVRAGLVQRAEDWVLSSAWSRLHPNDPRGLPLCDWPIPRPVDWLNRVNQALTGADALSAVDLTAVVRGSNKLPNTLDDDPHSARADVHQRRNNRSNALIRSKPTAYGRATLIGSADPA